MGLRSVMLRASLSYHARCMHRYWNAAQTTHASMEPATFDFYAERIAALIGSQPVAGPILDHGAGRGEIGTRLMQRGYDVEFSEVSTRFLDCMRHQGLRCHGSEQIPAGRYQVAFANNSIFYTHPRRLIAEIDRLLDCLVVGGRLLLLDVPVVQRMARLAPGPLKSLVWRATQVIQPEAGGFFVDEGQVLKAYPRTRITDSWADYRVHFEIVR